MLKSLAFGRSQVQDGILRTSAPNPMCGKSMALSKGVRFPFILPRDEQGSAYTWLIVSEMGWGHPSALLLSPGCWRCLNLLWSCSLELSPEVGTISLSFQVRLLFYVHMWWNFPPLPRFWILCLISLCFSLPLSNSTWRDYTNTSLCKDNKVLRNFSKEGLYESFGCWLVLEMQFIQVHKTL